MKHTIAYKYIDNIRKTLQYCIHDSWKSIDCTMGLRINAQCQLTSVEGMIYITSIHSFTILSYLSSITHTHFSYFVVDTTHHPTCYTAIHCRQLTTLASRFGIRGAFLLMKSCKSSIAHETPGGDPSFSTERS